jgi:hypothetical protein
VLAFAFPAVTYDRFTPLNSIMAVAEAVIGGVGFIVGTLLGAPLSSGSFGSIIALHFQSIDEWLPLVGGVALLIILLSDPDGLVPLNLKAAKAEVESKWAYFRLEVLLLVAYAKGRQHLGTRLKAIVAKGGEPSIVASELPDPMPPAVKVVKVVPTTLAIEEVSVGTAASWPSTGSRLRFAAARCSG